MEPEKIKALASLVIERLNEKRVGFLWPAAPVFLERQQGFRWVHYCHEAFVPTLPTPWGQTVSLLEELGESEGEGRTLNMLVVPSGNAGILCEVASGMTVSLESFLIEGALEASIPVLFDASPFNAWLRFSSSKRARACDRVLESLSQRGMKFMGLSKITTTTSTSEISTSEISIISQISKIPEVPAVTVSGGWFSWVEIAPFARESMRRGSVIRLAKGARLTPEAFDRLTQLKIRVEEVF
ncbi:MAG: hypothetical protein LBJ36_01400 [Synergistaceae bacterium]|jgi:hypothetical protein|nr:hypothetical protein [Synergistaceae bacterium]